MLHGWGANRNTFNRLAKDLSLEYKVYQIDLPGFGESTIDFPLVVLEVGKILSHFCTKLEIENPIIIGHSYGCRIAVVLANYINVSKLILVSAAGIKEHLGFNKRFRVKLYKIIKKSGLKIKMGSTDYKNSDDIRRGMLVNAVNTDLSDFMNNIKAPTILIYGKNDKVTPIDLGRKINKKILNSKLIEIDNAEHFPYITCYKTFYLILKCFLEG